MLQTQSGFQDTLGTPEKGNTQATAESKPVTADRSALNSKAGPEAIAENENEIDAFDMLPYTLQQTQFECLKVLTVPNIILAYNEQRHKLGLEPDNSIDRDKILRDFINELAFTYAEQNKRFKVTVRKTYINDILFWSKGAQNLAQQVIMVVTDDPPVAQSSPAKKVKRVKPLVVENTSETDDEKDDKEPTVG